MFGAIRRLLPQRHNTPRADHLELGERGERKALEYLVKLEGYRVVVTNFRVPVGRGLKGQKLSAEIDIIAYDGDTLAFIEVKTRTSDDLAAPERAVNLRKQRQIARAARRYRQLIDVSEEPYRYDVVTIVPGEREDRIELLRGYFDDRVFQRTRFLTTER
ncbi:MAG TPA: YraN family protein [Blastocatellia bacterium]|nr:YraN family protein [Blastocatellia bacterium]